jgi:predicted nucleic acid-binding Zn ribbon protein
LGQPELLKFALTRQIRRMGCRKEIESAQVISSWNAVVGPQVSARARVESLIGGKLALIVPDAAWQQELSDSTPDLIKRLNECAGKNVVREIYFVTESRKKD